MKKLVEYKMIDEEGPVSIGHYRIGGQSVYAPVIKNLCHSDILIREWRHKTDKL